MRLACRAQTFFLCISFVCESAIVVLTVLQLLTAARSPRLHDSAAAGPRTSIRGDLTVTALSFALTCTSFTMVLLLRVRRIRERVGTAACIAQAHVHRISSFLTRSHLSAGTAAAPRLSGRGLAAAAPGLSPAQRHSPAPRHRTGGGCREAELQAGAGQAGVHAHADAEAGSGDCTTAAPAAGFTAAAGAPQRAASRASEPHGAAVVDIDDPGQPPYSGGVFATRAR